MKRTILIFGLISGLIVTAMWIVTSIYCYNDPNYQPSEVMGYTSMLIAFIFVFVGVKTYRDKHLGGNITFKEAFKVGFFIALIASTMYVGVWLIEYYFFMPDFMDRYADLHLKQAAAEGLSGAELAEKAKEMAKYKEWYKNPLLVILMTYAEILPLGIVVSLISALILKRKDKAQIAVA